MRSAPPEPFSCELTTPRLRRARLDAQRMTWTSAAVALAAAALVVTQLPHAPAVPDGHSTARAHFAAAPPRLPIGQRSAAEDFVAAERAIGRGRSEPQRT